MWYVVMGARVLNSRASCYVGPSIKHEKMRQFYRFTSLFQRNQNQIGFFHSYPLHTRKWSALEEEERWSLLMSDDLQFCGVRKSFFFLKVTHTDTNVSIIISARQIVAVIVGGIPNSRLTIWMVVQQCNLRSFIDAKSIKTPTETECERNADDTIGIPLVFFFCYAIDLWRVCMIHFRWSWYCAEKVYRNTEARQLCIDETKRESPITNMSCSSDDNSGGRR